MSYLPLSVLSCSGKFSSELLDSKPGIEADRFNETVEILRRTVVNRGFIDLGLDAVYQHGLYSGRWNFR